MKIITGALSIISGIGAILSAIFYVLFKQARDERNLLKKEAEEREQKQSNYVESKKENEELKNNLFNDGADGINSAIELMQNSAQRGKDRNNR